MNEPARTTRSWTTLLVSAAAVGAVAAGAALVADAVGDSPDPRQSRATPPPVTQATAPTPSGEQLRKARDLLARWERTVGDAVYVPLRPPLAQGDPELTGRFEIHQTGAWSRGQAAYQRGLAQRRIQVRTAVPDVPPAAGVVTWRNGLSVPTSVVSAKEAYDRLLAGAMRCSNCPADGSADGITPKPVTLTAVTLTTLVVETTRGDATVPAWRFTFAESRVQLLVAAAEAAQVSPAPLDQAAGMPIMDASIAPDGRTLTARLIGSGGSSKAPCGADYFGYVVESANAVGVVIVGRSYPGRVVCTMEGHMREVTVRLAAPLGGRSVLELERGTAVPLT